MDTFLAITEGLINLFLTWYSVHIFLEQGRKKTAYTILSIGILGVVVIAFSTHRNSKELEDQKQAVEAVKQMLQKSEVQAASDMGYLKAKLEDAEKWNDTMSQFAPAIAKFAETTATLEQKQYEAKVTSDKDLFSFTMEVVHKIRDFSQKYQTLDSQRSLQSMKNSVSSTEVERQKQWNQEIQDSIRISLGRDAEFRDSILADAIYARRELLNRKLPEPVLGRVNTNVGPRRSERN